MSSKRELLQQLVRDIRQDITDYQKLKVMLTTQRQLMMHHDNQRLIDHNRQQDQLVAELHCRSARRCQLLVQIGVSADAMGMDKLIKALPAASGQQFAKFWQQLKQLVIEAQQANEQNGQLLVRQQEMIDSLIASDPLETGTRLTTPYGPA